MIYGKIRSRPSRDSWLVCLSDCLQFNKTKTVVLEKTAFPKVNMMISYTGLKISNPFIEIRHIKQMLSTVLYICLGLYPV